MPAPNVPHIKTVYNKDGTMVKTPVGFGGSLCQTATQPYMARQGHFTSTPTSEANEPSYLEREHEGGEKASA